MRAAPRLLLLATTLCVAVSAFASDRDVRDAAHHCRFERPEAWTPLDAEILDEVRARIPPTKMPLECIAAFGAPRGEDGSRIPYVAVFFARWTSPPRTYAGLEKRFSKEMMVAGELVATELMGTPAPRSDDVVVDRARGRVTCHGTTTIVGVGDVATYAVGLVGKEGVVHLRAYARPADAAAAWALVDGVADSFRWDDGYEFREATTNGLVVGPAKWRDDANRWSTILPDGWTARPPTQGDWNRLVAWFAPKDAEPWIDPTVMVGWVPAEVGRASWAEFERDYMGDYLQRSFSETSFAFGATKSKVDCGRSVFDKLSGRTTTEFSIEFAGVRWKGIWVMHFGRDGAAQFVLHAMEKDFDAAKPAFESVVDSFRLDDGHRWEDAFPFESIDWAVVGRKAAAIAGLGALGVAIVWIVRARRAKRDGATARERLARSRPADVR